MRNDADRYVYMNNDEIREAFKSQGSEVEYMGHGIWRVLNPDNPVLVQWLQCVIGDTIALCSVDPVKSIRNKDYLVENYYKLYYLIVKSDGVHGRELVDELKKQGITDVCTWYYDPYFTHDEKGNFRDFWIPVT